MNFSFQSVCSTQIKMYQESGFLAFLVLCTADLLRPLDPHQAYALDPLAGLQRPPDPPAAPV